MKVQAMASVLRLSSWVLTAALTLVVGCQQEPPECQIGRSEFQAKYTLVEGTGSCSQIGGEIYGTHTYYKQGSDGYSDYDEPASVGIQSDTIGFALSEGARDNSGSPRAVGEFSSARPDENDICTVPTFDITAEQNTPEFTYLEDPDDPSTSVTVPATHRIYEWRDMRVLVSPAYAGSQWQATLTYTENGCTATYDVLAVMSVMSCETDADCHASRSTINPDFDVVCDVDLGACVLAGPVPSLR